MGDEGWKNMPKVMSLDTVKALTAALASLSKDQKAGFTTVLHGGEPLMLGARRLEHLLASLRNELGSEYKICMQTNGMLISDEILRICSDYKMSVSVSLDGPKKINDRFRIGHVGESTFDKVIAGISKLRAHRESEFLFSGLLTVIDPLSDPEEIYDFLKGLGAPSVDFLYRDGNHSSLPFGKTSFESTEFGTWLCQLLDHYLADPTPIRVRILDDILRLAVGGAGIKEGVGLTDFGIAVIDTDGSVSKNDTLKSAFNGSDRFQEHWSIFLHRLTDIFNTKEFENYHQQQRPESSVCKACTHLGVCGGGMPLHRWSKERQFDNPSVYCNDQKTIVEHVRMHLNREGIAA